MHYINERTAIILSEKQLKNQQIKTSLRLVIEMKQLEMSRLRYA